jgi:hypothetical protein
MRLSDDATSPNLCHDAAKCPQFQSNRVGKFNDNNVLDICNCLAPPLLK